MTLSAYEQREWDQLQKRKANALNAKVRHLLPAAARDRASTMVDVAKRVPVAELAEAAYATVVAEMGKVIGGAASYSVSSESVVKQYTKAGYEIGDIDGIHELDLQAVDSVAHLNRIRWGHSGSAALSGATAAAAISGGTVTMFRESIHKKGGKNAPSLGLVATAYGADLVATFGLAARTVASTAAYYGYDPRKREEQVFMMSVIGLAMTAGGPAKTAAYQELSHLTQALFRGATWAKLSESVLTRIAQRFATRFSLTLTQKKLGQFVPVAGVVVGAGLNFALVDRVAAAANDAYRERFLIDKSNGTVQPVALDVHSSVVLDGTAMGVLDLLEEEDVLPELEA